VRPLAPAAVKYTWFAVLLTAAVSAAADPPVTNLSALPQVSFTRPDGSSFSLDVLKGRPALVNFWGTWCPPCRDELPLLAKAHGKYGRKVAFVGLAVEDKAEFAGEFARAYQLPYPVAAGREPAIVLMQALGNTAAGMPYTVIVNSRGDVVFAKRGRVTRKELDKALASLSQ
jgi:thiol-disulfide isomerase/thioredoxin